MVAMRLVRLSAALAIAVSALTLTGTVSAEGSHGQYPDLGSLYSQVDGVSTPIAVGSTVAVGELKPSGPGSADDECSFGTVKVGAVGDRYSQPSEIVIRVTEDCRMVVQSVTESRRIPTGPPPIVSTSEASLFATSTLGVAYSTYNDFIGIDLTYVYAELTYLDDGSSVYGGYNEWHECYTPPGGWSQRYCYTAWSPGGPSEVWSWTLGGFQYAGGNWLHEHQAEYDGWPGGGYNYWCSHSGSLVPRGEWDCDGGRYT